MHPKHPSVSVIVVSRGRPKHLKLCLRALSRQQFGPFEVVVVADPAGISAVRQAGFADRVKLQPFDRPNISAARNLGLDAAAGDVVAFIDDDAAAEPAWLLALAAPFADPDIVAATGYVRGQNGVSFQSRAQTINVLGETQDLSHDSSDILVPDLPQGIAVKTVGTNCAFRKSSLLSVGGFDEAFRFYLEDADVSLRLLSLGRTAIVPEAEVHHAFAASDRRQANRVPRSLFEIGRSSAMFLRRHANRADMSNSWQAIHKEQCTRVLRHMQAGRLLPGDVHWLCQDLAKGWQVGSSTRVAKQLPGRQQPNHVSFREFCLGADTEIQPGVTAFPERLPSCSVWPGAAFARQNARADIAVDLAPCPFPEQYVAPGKWFHLGGLLGHTAREVPRDAGVRYRQRVAEEMRRFAKICGVSPKLVNVL